MELWFDGSPIKDRSIKTKRSMTEGPRDPGFSQRSRAESSEPFHVTSKEHTGRVSMPIQSPRISRAAHQSHRVMERFHSHDVTWRFLCPKKDTLNYFKPTPNTFETRVLGTLWALISLDDHLWGFLFAPTLSRESGSRPNYACVRALVDGIYPTEN